MFCGNILRLWKRYSRHFLQKVMSTPLLNIAYRSAWDEETPALDDNILDTGPSSWRLRNSICRGNSSVRTRIKNGSFCIALQHFNIWTRICHLGASLLSISTHLSTYLSPWLSNNHVGTWKVGRVSQGLCCWDRHHAANEQNSQPLLTMSVCKYEELWQANNWTQVGYMDTCNECEWWQLTSDPNWLEISPPRRGSPSPSVSQAGGARPGAGTGDQGLGVHL